MKKYHYDKCRLNRVINLHSPLNRMVKDQTNIKVNKYKDIGKLKN